MSFETSHLNNVEHVSKLPYLICGLEKTVFDLFVFGTLYKTLCSLVQKSKLNLNNLVVKHHIVQTVDIKEKEKQTKKNPQELSKSI